MVDGDVDVGFAETVVTVRLLQNHDRKGTEKVLQQKRCSNEKGTNASRTKPCPRARG